MYVWVIREPFQYDEQHDTFRYKHCHEGKPPYHASNHSSIEWSVGTNAHTSSKPNI